MQALQAELQEELRELRESPLQAQQAEHQFKQQLAALPALKARHSEPDNPFGLQHLITDEPGTAAQCAHDTSSSTLIIASLAHLY